MSDRWVENAEMLSRRIALCYGIKQFERESDLVQATDRAKTALQKAYEQGVEDVCLLLGDHAAAFRNNACLRNTVAALRALKGAKHGQ